MQLVESEIGLVPVLGENAYDLENGEASVFARELKGQDKGRFAVQHRRMIVAGRDYKHDDRCLACHGACNNDKVKKCRLCPVALHAKCAVNGASGKEAHNATWQCPQHACSVCARIDLPPRAACYFGARAASRPSARTACLEMSWLWASRGGTSRSARRSQAAACYIRCSKACTDRLGEEDALQPPPIQTFEPLDLSEVDARNKTLFRGVLGEGRRRRRWRGT